MLFLAIVFISAATGKLGEMPSIEQLENPKTNLATAIYSSDGVVLGKFYLNDNRTPISFSQLPDNIIEALIATEDERFYSHSGIDFKGTLRAIFYLGKKGGASTITQQLARQLFVGVRSRNKIEAVIQKVKEWVLAVKLERRFTKSEIIAMYLNIYDFGKAITAYPRFVANAKESGLTIEIGTAETLGKDSIPLMTDNVNYTDSYITKKGLQSWHPITWRGYRYLAIKENENIKTQILFVILTSFFSI